MEPWLIWVVVAFALIIAELLTGTFYLLAIGVAGFAGALVAWMGGNLAVQTAVTGVLAIAGCFLVHRWHTSQNKGDEGRVNFLDRGQPVVLEGWVDENARVARVKYRGAWWDAKLKRPEEKPAPGSTLYIDAQEGSTLVITTNKEA
jgi:membrane protein implicated in regulation of membrane protease activity